MRLSERVHLVGSGWLGYSLSDRHDCHVYLVDGGSACFLVDAGCGLDAAGIAARISALNLAPVTHILVTHGHADHAAGAGELARLLGGAKVCASPEVARILAEADEVASGLATARAAGIYPPHLKLAPVGVQQLHDESWRIGDVTVRSLPTAGHAAGHLCFLADFPDGTRAAFTGDLVFARGRVAVLAMPDTDLMALKESIASVALTDPTALFPGHGSVTLTRAGEHLTVALDAFARGALPPPLLP